MIRIRDATDSDADALAALISDLGYPTEAIDIPRRLQRFCANGACRVLVAVAGNRVAAFAAIELTRPIHHDHPVAHLSAFAVATGARRNGIGRQLLEAVEESAREAGCQHAVVTSAEHRADAHAFYPAAGWLPTGRRFGKALCPSRPHA